jgi:hypothetical protein
MSSDTTPAVPNKPAEQYLSVAQYAAHRGCSDSYVRRLRREDRIVTHPQNRKRIDRAASDAKLLLEGDPLRGGDRTGVEIGGASMAAPGPLAAAAAVGSGNDEGGVREAVRRERMANARIAELKLGEATKEFTRTKEVDRVVYTLARQALERLRVIGSRLATQLAPESDPAKCEAIIDKEIRTVCEEMQAAAAKLLASHGMGMVNPDPAVVSEWASKQRKIDGDTAVAGEAALP